jgi:hypothetical protein
MGLCFFRYQQRTSAVLETKKRKIESRDKDEVCTLIADLHINELLLFMIYKQSHVHVTICTRLRYIDSFCWST